VEGQDSKYRKILSNLPDRFLDGGLVEEDVDHDFEFDDIDDK
jgi:hypothetical protein